MVAFVNIPEKKVYSAFEKIGFNLSEEIYPSLGKFYPRIENIMKRLKLEFDDPICVLFLCLAFQINLSSLPKRYKKAGHKKKQLWFSVIKECLQKMESFADMIYNGCGDRVISEIQRVLEFSSRDHYVVVKTITELPANIERITAGKVIEVFERKEQNTLPPAINKRNREKKALEEKRKISAKNPPIREYCIHCGEKPPHIQCKKEKIKCGDEKYCVECGNLMSRPEEMSKRGWTGVKYCPNCYKRRADIFESKSIQFRKQRKYSR